MNPIRSILGWPSAAGHLLGSAANAVGPAIFGDSSIPLDPVQRTQALRTGLINAGLATAESAGAPRRWGEFAPSPIASVLAGVEAGRAGYQGVQQQARRQQAYGGILDGGATPSNLSRLLSTAVLLGDPDTAKIAGAALDNGVGVGNAPAPFDLSPGANRYDANGHLIASNPRAPSDGHWTAPYDTSGHLHIRNLDTGATVDLGPATRPEGQGQPRASQQQSTAAALGVSALSAWKAVEDLRRSNPAVETEVGRVMSAPKFVRAIPLLHNANDAAAAAASAGASDAAQQYIRRKWAFMDDILRTRGSTSRMSAQLFQQYQNEFMPGLDAGGNQSIRDNEVQALLAAQDLSGYSDNPGTWNDIARRHGVDSIDLQDIRMGGTGNRKLTDINSRYPVGRP